MRSPIFTASSMSWVTNTIVLRTVSWRRRNSSCSRIRVTGSMAPNGSSMSSTGGSAARARHAHPLALAAGQLGRVPPPVRRRVEAHELEELVHAGLDATRSSPAGGGRS